MSLQSTPPSSPPPPANQRSGCLTAFLILLGLIMLLPGVCGIIIVSTDMKAITRDGRVLSLLAFGACGIVVIWLAVRPRR